MKNRLLILLFSLLLPAFVSADVSSTSTGADIVKVSSKHNAKETMDRFEKIVSKKGFTVFARVDHRAGAKKVGLDMNDAEVLIFGNPKGGTLIMKLDPAAGLDLPLRVLVYTDNEGKTWLSYHNPQSLKNNYDVAKSPVLAKIENGLAKLTAKAAE